MIPIKIECGCGQRYAFEVEPVAGCMPTDVACPACGADGTAAANAIIAAGLSSARAPVAAPAGAVRVRAAAPAPAAIPPASPAPPPRPTAALTTVERLAGRVDRAQAEHEARAKISWGDAPDTVMQYLMMQGFSMAEARGTVQALVQERAATIRANGVKKVFTGIGLMCVPVVAFFIFASIKVFPLYLFGATIAAGLWGAWMVLKGSIMMLSPKSEPGDIATQ